MPPPPRGYILRVDVFFGAVLGQIVRWLFDRSPIERAYRSAYKRSDWDRQSLLSELRRHSVTGMNSTDYYLTPETTLALSCWDTRLRPRRFVEQLRQLRHSEAMRPRY